MPKLYMMVGVPLSGKSTWLRANRGMGVVLSTDDMIDAIARATSTSYNDLWKGQIDRITTIMYDVLELAVKQDRDIYWDQTNITVKSRRDKMARIGKNYHRIAVVFETPAWEILSLRNDQRNARENKYIPQGVIARMMKQLELPTVDEGFDEIKIIRNFG